MDVYLNEHEQAELIKKWWAKNGVSIIVGIVLGLLLMYGYQYWQKHHLRSQQQASILYEQMLTSYIDKNTDMVSSQANDLMTHYKRTPYASAASFLLAKQAVDNGQLNEANTHLDWVMAHSKNASYRQVARIRKARILMQQQHADQALDTLKTVDDKAYQALINEVRGDALYAEGKREKARLAYQAALQLAPVNSTLRPILQMKINNVAENA